MTSGRAAVSHIMIDFDKSACNLKSKHNAAPSRRFSPELCFVMSPSDVRGRREGRVPAGTRGPLCEVALRRIAQRHTGVAETTRPSLRGGFTAYAVLSPGSDALLPPSPCGWLMCASGRTTRITTRLGAQTPGARTTRFCRTRTAPVVCARRSLTVSRPAKPIAPTPPASTTSHPACRDDRDNAPRPGWDGLLYDNPKF